MSDDRREREETGRLEALFRADPGPSSSELAEARLKLKRALARERAGGAAAEGDAAGPGERGGPALRLAPRRWMWIASQAAGFALLVALLVPVLPRVLPAGASARAPVDLVASLADEARTIRARIRPWLPSLPALPSLTLPTDMSMGMRSAPASALFDWIPSLHSDAR
jgi:hypothetical protein